VRDLSVDEFQRAMGRVSTSLLVLIRRAALIHATIANTLTTSAGRAAVASAAETEDCERYAAAVTQRGASMLARTCELAQERYMRLLKVRKEQHIRHRLADFVRISRGAREFLRDVDHLCPGQALSTLDAELDAHACEFLRHKHTEAEQKLVATLEIETWKQVQVAPEFQVMVRAFEQNQVPRLTEDELVRLRESEPASEEDSGRKATVAVTAPSAQEVTLAGNGYKMVPSSLLLLTAITQCMQCLSSLPAVGAQIAHLLPRLLKVFHTLTYRQVLKAGALRPESAGLKTITFKHLALALQSLSLVVVLVPHFKAILAAHVPEEQRSLLAESDSAQQDYAKHSEELLDKFVSILDERRRQHMGGSGSIPPLALALTPSDDKRRPDATPCIKAVAKDLALMHKQLQPLLSRSHLQTVFARVLAAFDEGLLSAYQAINTSALFTRQCIVADVLFLRQDISKLHLALPHGCCPKLTVYAKSMSVT